MHAIIGLVVLGVVLMPPAASAQFAGGDGSATNPYEVASAAHLDAVRQFPGAHFVQTADIELSVAPWNEGTGWWPIGENTTTGRFRGVYDGGGYAIRGLTIDRGGVSYQGLFGYATNASWRRLRLDQVSVKGASHVGGLAGYTWLSSVEYVRVEGSVQTIGGNVGGLIGMAEATIVHACSASGTVSGLDYAGGLIGHLYNGSELRHSFAEGSVTGTMPAGGLVGQAYLQNPIIADCYSRAAVSGSQRVGGLVGLSEHVYRSYSTGPVSASTTNFIGGLVGYNFGVVRDSYWDTNTSGRTSSSGGVGLDAAAMKQQATYPRYNFATLWTIEEGVDYPVFRDLAAYEPLRVVMLDALAGAGTRADPYVITNHHQLHAMRLSPSNHFRLAANIDMTPSVAWDLGRGWTPVGVFDPFTNRFSGGLDGGGFVISHLVINRPRSEYQGLIGYAEDSVLRHVRFAGLNMQVGARSGGAVASGNRMELDDIAVEGDVISGSWWVGGVAGYFGGPPAQRLRMSGSVTGGRQVGGVIGRMDRTELRHSASEGHVIGATNEIGGLVGHAYGVESMVLDSYSRASVIGRREVGGLVGKLEEGSILRAYSAGLVTGTSVTNIGGLAGTNVAGRVRESYWDVEASGQAQSAGGMGLTTAAMRSRGTYRYFNFGALWAINDGVDYPLFRDWSGYEQPRGLLLGDLPGTGSPADPYVITNVHGLRAMRLGMTNHFRLGADIEAADTVVWDAGRGWTPVGTEATANRFAGHFDGAGHVIRNLALNRPTNTYQGLFGYAYTGSISAVRLEGVNVHGARYSGALAGWSQYVRMEDVKVDGAVLAYGDDAGGVAGSTSGDLWYRVAAAVDVGGQQRVGGLAGNAASQFVQVSATGTVVGTTNVGGAVGLLTMASAEILDGFSRAGVTGAMQVGGLVGFVSEGEVVRAWSAGAVAAAGSNFVGGLVGRNTGLIRDAYWDTNASGRAESAGGTGYATAAMLQPATYAGFDFDEVWAIEEAFGYPCFAGVRVYEPPQALTLGDLAGAGTEGDPYIITNVHQLHTMRLGLTNYYRLGGSIDMSDCTIWDMGRGWLGVGTTEGGNYFRGHFDGDGYTLRNLRINRPLGFYQGLLGYMQEATAREVNLVGVDVQGSGTCGTLAGSMTRCAVEGVSVSGYVYAAGGEVGGLAGEMISGVVQRVRMNGVVRGGNTAGGLVGFMHTGARLFESYALGSVIGSNAVGGVVGRVHVPPTRVVDCFSRASVQGWSQAGGLAGLVEGGLVSNVYAAGDVRGGTTNHIGGLVGAGTGVVRTSYWDVEVSGQATSAGGEGRTTDDMTYPYAGDLYVGWDFGGQWLADESGGQDGYPELRGMYPDVFELRYESDVGGALSGNTRQYVRPGDDGTPVDAIPEDGAVFSGWSDGSLLDPRVDTNVQASSRVMASFQSVGGVPIPWYSGYGIEPEAGETWNDVDQRFNPAKDMTLRQEYIADTDPRDDEAVFSVTALTLGAGATSHFPSSSNRYYTLQITTDLKAGTWTNVPGAGPRLGLGGPDSLTDTTLPSGARYRLDVRVSP